MTMADTVRGDDDGELPKIGNPARRALLAHGYTRLDQLTSVSETTIAGWHGVGPKALGILREALAARGLAFASGPAEETEIP